MKFTNGYWLVRDDLSLHQATAAGDIVADASSITLYAPTKGKGSRSQLDGVFLTVTFFSPLENVIGVKIAHHRGAKRSYPRFIEEKHACGEVLRAEGQICLKSGDMMVKIQEKDAWNVEFWQGDTLLTRSGWRSAGYAKMDSGEAYIKEELSLGVGENVYGMGERFTSFIKNGQVVDIWNRDGGTSSEQAYKNIPFYVTSKGYGVLVNDPGLVSFEVASEKVERVQFSVPGECLEYYVFGGGSMKAALENYCRLTGFPALPPAWSFGLWLSTSFTTDYSEETVNSFVDGMLERNIPLSVFHFDCFWMKGHHWCDFLWDEASFPDPEGMLRRLKAKGLKICVWINPYIAQRSRLFDEGMEKGYFIHKENGEIWQTDLWQPGMAIVDFTNPAACAWYQGELKRLMDMGVDTFKTDFGERIPHEGVMYHSGDAPDRMHNYFTELYNRAVFELLERERGAGDALVFARSATAGGQKYPVHWGGDCVASYESMAESLRGGLSLVSCGFGFWSHDMGGFEATATPDLYKRWVAFGMFSTHSRLHGSSSYRVPWLFDEESVEVLRYFAQRKEALMPYLFAEAAETHRTGTPLMRPMVMEFPRDPVAGYLDRQYMLGSSLLVAPVFSEDGRVEYYLPEGEWTNLLTNARVKGGWQSETHSYKSMPVMVPDNTLLPMGDREAPTLHLFGLKKKAECALVSAEGTRSSSFTATRGENSIRIQAESPSGDWSLCLRNIDAISSQSAGTKQRGEQGLLLSFTKEDTDITVILA